jgi:hypothetical protein
MFIVGGEVPLVIHIVIFPAPFQELSKYHLGKKRLPSSAMTFSNGTGTT